MTKSMLAVGVASAVFAGSSNGAELYNNPDVGAVDLGVSYSAFILQGKDTNTVEDGASRLWLIFSKDLGDGWTGFARSEWGVVLTNNVGGVEFVRNTGGNSLRPAGADGESFFIRKGFVGIKKDGVGELTLGKQWGLSYDIGGVTDNFYVFGGKASGTYNFGIDGGISGTGRAEQALQYDVEILGGLDLGVQFQFTDETIYIVDDDTGDIIEDTDLAYDNSFAVKVGYTFDFGLMIGAVYNKANLKIIDDAGVLPSLDVSDTLLTFGASYGSLANKGLYAALVLTTMEYHEINDLNSIMADAMGAELMVKYNFENNWGVHGGFNYLSDESSGPLNQYELTHIYLGTDYQFTKGFSAYIEGVLDSTKGADGSDIGEDQIGLGFRMDF
ncbi:porin [Thalassotalea agarivorans]|nr:porin [Thalassotalea agarivorans]